MLRLLFYFGCFSGGVFAQERDTLIAEFSMYVYNNGADTIHLTDVGSLDYYSCNEEDSILNQSIFSRLPDFPPVKRMDDNNTSQLYTGESKTNCMKLEILDSIQLDGQGAKEILFSRKLAVSSCHASHSVTSSEYYNLEKIEIWNLDTKSMLFDLVISYDESYSGTSFYGGSWQGTKRYYLDYRIQPSGGILVSDKIGFYTERTNYSRHYGMYSWEPGLQDILAGKAKPREPDCVSERYYPICEKMKYRMFRLNQLTGRYYLDSK